MDRGILFGVWVKMGKNAEATRTALEAIASSAVDVVEQGGRVIASGTLDGQQFTYAFPDKMTARDAITISYDLWKAIRTLTDQQLTDFIVDKNGNQTDRRSVSFYRYD